ncbi:LysR family transcriptional regulator [Leminorella grimontii]|uniref:LysR family transcriptional regulator n=1 Tax=Leminorella grimontii TaxID=82981 RepID=UPI0020863B1D|nr:LysR family transcriptional regulator [Leminorella grimontii]GKX59071.1 LysR family transcriptional regulator [Leminorella grimontii]
MQLIELIYRYQSMPILSSKEMDLRHLKYFLAVAETQNIRLAAQKVHVTQPAISRKIKELESELGVQLFDRLPKGLCLNRAGKVYQKRLGTIMKQIEDANAKVRQLSNTEYGSLSLGAPDFVLWEGEVTQCISQFCRANLLIELEAYSDTPTVLLKRLELEQIDGAFLYYFSPLSAEYSIQHVAEDKLVLAYPTGWEGKISSSTTIEELNAFPSIRLPRSADPHYYDWQETLFQNMGWKPEMTQWAHSESTILGLVAAGNGVAIVNERHFVRSSNMVSYTTLDILLNTIPLSFIYKNTSNNPALKAFLNLISGKMR